MYAKVAANDNINMKIEEGEFITLVGPSGCGKTTTLRMIAGLLSPSSGSIFFDDEDVTHTPTQNRGIGMVFQDYALFPHLNVWDNIGFGLKIQKYPKDQVKQRVRQGVEMVNLIGLEGRALSELSGGQRQRVALARALVMEPRVFLLDEPLSNLDAKLRLHMRTELKRIHKRIGVTTIYVTHDQVEAMTLSNRVIIMLDGKIQQKGTPKEVYEKPINRFVGGFMGSPPMNFLENCEIIRENDHLFLVVKGIRFSVPRHFYRAIERLNLSTVTTGIRPEDLSDRNDAVTSQYKSHMLDDTIEMTIDVIEPIGANKLLDLYHKDLRLSAIVKADSSVLPDQHINIKVNLERIHLFDPKTEESLAYFDKL